MTEPVIPDDILHALTDIYERGWYAAEDALRAALATAEARNETLERVVEAVARLHTPVTLEEVLAADCFEEACEHFDEPCPHTSVTVCAYCWEIKTEVDDEARIEITDEYPCPTAAALASLTTATTEGDGIDTAPSA